MKKPTSIIAILLLVSFVVFPLTTLHVKANTITVPDNYSTIQAAINHASTGDTVYVKNGIYHECVVVNKSISLVGQSRTNTIIDGSYLGDVVLVNASNILISNFTIRNSGSSPKSGILFSWTQKENIAIRNNVITNNYYGCRIRGSDNVNITQNSISNNNLGLEISVSDHNRIERNSITSSASTGVSVSNSDNNIFSQNNVSGSGNYGVSFTTSYSNDFTGNRIETSSGTYGMRLFDTHYCNFLGNTIRENNESIWMSDSTWNNLTENHISESRVGLVLEQWIGGPTEFNFISENKVEDNRDGDIVLAGVRNNTVAYNVVTNGSAGILVCTSTYGSLSNDNTVVGNAISSCNHGISVLYVPHNNFTMNSVTNCYIGLALYRSNSSLFKENIFGNNTYGVLHLYSTDNTLYHNNFIDNIHQVYYLVSSLANAWDDGYPSGGNYWSDYTGDDEYSGLYQNETGSDGIGDDPLNLNQNNVDNYPLMNPWPIPLYDLAILNVTSTKTSTGKGYDDTICLTLKNQGAFTETFNVTIYGNSTAIGTLQVMLETGETRALEFNWSTGNYNKANYTFSAFVTPIPYEMNLTNNNVTHSWTLVTIPGDVDADRDVDISDIVKITSVYGSTKGQPNYKPNCDINNDGIINILDTTIATSHYGQRW